MNYLIINAFEFWFNTGYSLAIRDVHMWQFKQSAIAR